MFYLVAFIYGAVSFHIHRYFPFSIIFISLSFLLCAVIRRKAGAILRLLRLALLLLLSASGFYYARFSYAPGLPPAGVAGTVVGVSCIAASEAARITSGADVYSQAVSISAAADENNKPLYLKELRLLSPVALLPERRYLVKARISGDAYFMNPGGYGKRLSGYVTAIEEENGPPAAYSARDAVRGTRAKLNKGIRDNFSEESAPFLMSIVTGERGLLPGDLHKAFNATGLAHILSISGSHFGLMFIVLFGLFRALLRLIPYSLLSRLTLYCTPSQSAAVLSIPFMVGYLGISDASVPAIRSFIMIMLFLFGLLVQRKGFWLNTVLLAAAVIIVIQPDSLLELSFQLSFIAVLAIGTAAEKRNGEPEMGRNGDPEKQHGLLNLFSASPVLRFIVSSLRISIAAAVATGPLVAFYFHYFSIVSPFTNLIFTPAIGFVILPLILASSCCFLVSGEFPLHAFIGRITDALLGAVKYIAQWNFADVGVPSFPPALLIVFYCGALFYLVNDRSASSVKGQALTDKDNNSLDASRSTLDALRSLSPLVVAVVPFFIYAGVRSFDHRGLCVTYLDVGQGDAAVVELPDSRTLVIDTGRNGLQVAEFLRYRGIRRIDAVVLSHGQADHTGGLRQLLGSFKVGEVWDNDRLVYSEGLLNNARHRGLQRGDVISGSGYAITALHPYEGFYADDVGDAGVNNASLVLRIKGARNVFLFAGDVEEAAGENMAQLGGHLKSTVLKVPHHGSRSSVNEEFLCAVSPSVAVISVGRGNPYGHPHEETLASLRAARVYRTDRDGAVGVRETASGDLVVKTWKESRLSETSALGGEVANLKKLFLVW